jgi:hypothetical protein
MLNIGRILLISGGVLVLAGLLFMLLGSTGILGKLPGDFFFRKGSFSFYFPLVTSLILSVVLTVILNIVLRLFK